MKYRYFSLPKVLVCCCITATLSALSSCDSYLDELPDNRTELTSEKKIQGLLTSAYLSNDPLYVAELMSDNMDSYGETNPNTSRFADQVYNWLDVTESDNQSPERFWEDCYVRIATANKALEAIEEMGGATTETLVPAAVRHCSAEPMPTSCWPTCSARPTTSRQVRPTLASPIC